MDLEALFEAAEERWLANWQRQSHGNSSGQTTRQRHLSDIRRHRYCQTVACEEGA